MYRGAVILKDGNIEVITAREDVIDIVREKLGSDVCIYIEDMVKDNKEVIASFENELEYLDGEIVGFQNTLGKIEGEVGVLQDRLKESGIDSDDINKILSNITNLITNCC